MPMLDDDTLITKALLQRFVTEAHLEAGNGSYYACLQRSNGEFVAHHPEAPAAIGEQTLFAADVLRRLNKDLHHDGAWVIVFTHPEALGPGHAIFSQPGHVEYRRYVLMWLDQDGDVQIPIEWIKGECDQQDFTEILMDGIDPILSQCEAAWGMWHLHMRQVIDPREGDTFKRAKGERRASTRH